MRLGIVIVFACLWGLAMAGETELSGTEIRTLLTDSTVIGDKTRQVFYASGRTLYNDGHDSWGYWEVRGDQYCSNWPPQQGWACYDMTTRDTGDGLEITWIGDSGTRYVTHLESNSGD
ncbi:MAG: hypothetical protein AAGA26_01665 [Pseudomonadota bacterium]